MSSPLDSRWNPGDIISARKLNLPVDQADRNRRSPVGAPLASITTPAGRFLTHPGEEQITWCKITSGGTGGRYGGPEQLPQSGGTWVSGPRTFSTTAGGTPIIEVNGNTTLPTDGSVRVMVRLAPTANEWLFQFGACAAQTYPPTLQSPPLLISPRRAPSSTITAATASPLGSPHALAP